jgi:hypothetical protein
MVLCLPILLLLMALMINFGTVASWKIRAESVARLAVWGSRFPRIGDAQPRPDYWPESAGVSTGSEEDAAVLDDPRVHQPVARGPLPFGAVVNERLLDPTRGFRQGAATLGRDYPMLRRMGPYRSTATTHLLDDKWQYPQMGLSSNRQRRIPVIYALAKAAPSLVNMYSQAAWALLKAPFQPQLRPLDNDEEFIYYSNLFGWGTGPPDFHPRLRPFGTLDLALAAERVQDLIDRIQGKVQPDDRGRTNRKIPGVPEKMTRAFIRLYQRVIDELRARSGTPPPPLVQAQIRELEKKIEQLTQFLGTL